MIEPDTSKAIRKRYQLRQPISGGKYMQVTVPYEFVEREARSRGMGIAEFIQKYEAVAQYDAFDGIFYTFEPVEEKDKRQK